MPLTPSESSPEALAYSIDHTQLRPEATEADITRACEEAREYHFMSVCVEPKWVALAHRLLTGSSVIPITVVGFPGGSVPTAQKVEQTRQAIEAGAREIDMVLNREWLKAKDYAAVLVDIEAVVEAADKIPVKVILETSELSREEKIIACALSKAAGARFVKTSTGFSKGGATEEDVRLMREIVGSEVGVKASGGVRTRADALRMIAAGADRLGTSASIVIVQGAAPPSTPPGKESY